MADSPGTLDSSNLQVARARVRRSLITIAMMATALALLPAIYGETIPVANLARLFVVILACALVFQGRMWARWVLVVFVGLVAAFALLTAVADGTLPFWWRLAFGVLGARVLWELRFLFFSGLAREYFDAVRTNATSNGGV